MHRLTLTWKGGRVRLATCSCGWLVGRPHSVEAARRRFAAHVEQS